MWRPWCWAGRAGCPFCAVYSRKNNKPGKKSAFPRDGAALRSCGGASQSAGHVHKNPPYQPHMAAPWHPPAGSVCFVFWADRGPGASCPYGEGPRRALVTFPRWKVTRGDGGAAPQSYPQARFDVSPPQAALGPGWRSAPKLPTGTLQYKPPQAALGPGSRSAPPLSRPQTKKHPLGGAFCD